MGNFKAVRLNASTYPAEAAEREELAGVGAVFSEIEGQQPAEILAAAEDCDALLVVSSAIPRQVIERLRSCRVISRLGAGTDKIDVAAATEHGILVTNVPDFCLNEQAEHTMTLLLAFHRRLPYLMEAMQSRRIGGAALDVFDGINVFAEPGPPPVHPFFELDNVLLTPHCAGSSVESSFDSKTRGARNAALVLSGQLREHIVNPEVLDATST